MARVNSRYCDVRKCAGYIEDHHYASLSSAPSVLFDARIFALAAVALSATRNDVHANAQSTSENR